MVPKINAFNLKRCDEVDHDRDNLPNSTNRIFDLLNMIFFSNNNVKKLFFTLCLNLLTLFDSLTLSDKPFQISSPKYD